MGLFTGLSAYSQQAGPPLAIDVNAGQHAISPDIYGISFYWNTLTNNAVDPAMVAAAADVRATTRRWGGNGTSTYNWKYDVNNLDSDWYFEVLPGTLPAGTQLPDGSGFNQFADQARVSGGKILATIPMLGWLPKGRFETCSYDQNKYPNQCKTDPFAQYHQPLVCGDGIQYDSGCGTPSVNDGKSATNPIYIQNDPNDAYAPSDQNFQVDWIRYLVSRYGKANQGGVTLYSLDNEPIWWDNVHRDIHPKPYTYDELLSVDTTYAAAIKQADPTALVTGPVADNWSSLWFSKTDITSGFASGNYWSNPVDQNAHGGVPILPWYLQQMKLYEQQHGFRLLDYVDIHTYYEPSGIHTGTDSNGNTLPESDAVKQLRMDSTREFWDPTYLVSGDFWIKDVDNNGAPVAPMIIPRLKQMVAQNYPGTKTAISEYNWTAFDTLSGGLAEAEILGVFGREGLDAGFLWGPTKPTDPVAFAFKMYRNYDGIGGAFGDQGVQATSGDLSQLSVYAAMRSDLNLTAVVINKTNNDLSTTLGIANFNAGAAAKVWRYSGAQLGAIVEQADAPVASGSIATVFPANSVTMLVVPPATYPVPKPVVTAVTSAASYGNAIAPGQMVSVWGTNLGPAKPVGLQQDTSGMVTTSTGGVRILFDGVPAPMVFAFGTQCSAVVPYFGATKATTHVQVEYQGVRSDPLEVPVAATAPGLFTSDTSGKGQGAISNADGVTPNSVVHPSHPGDVVVLWGTGEGLTNPPGVDGRPAVNVLPKPVAAVTVTIGGLDAAVQYAGAAPYNIPGLIQINAVVPAGVAAGSSVPVSVKIGDATSQDGVTLAVQ